MNLKAVFIKPQINRQTCKMAILNHGHSNLREVEMSVHVSVTCLNIKSRRADTGVLIFLTFLFKKGVKVQVWVLTQPRLKEYFQICVVDGDETAKAANESLLYI